MPSPICLSEAVFRLILPATSVSLLPVLFVVFCLLQRFIFFHFHTIFAWTFWSPSCAPLCSWALCSQVCLNLLAPLCFLSVPLPSLLLPGPFSSGIPRWCPWSFCSSPQPHTPQPTTCSGSSDRPPLSSDLSTRTFSPVSGIRGFPSNTKSSHGFCAENKIIKCTFYLCIFILLNKHILKLGCMSLTLYHFPWGVRVQSHLKFSPCTAQGGKMVHLKFLC